MAGNPLLLGAERRKIGGFRERGTFDPLSIFQVGEQGLWADPSDLTPEKISWRRNLLTWSEFNNGVTDAPIRGGLLTATALTGYGGALAFGYDGSTATFAYKSFAHTAGATYTLSVIVQMTDGLAPSFGNAVPTSGVNTFSLVGNGQAATTASEYVVTALGGDLYRVSWTYVASGTNGNTGVSKAATNNNRTFKVTGYQLEAAPTASSYQRITDFTSDFLAAFPTHALYQDSAGTTPVTALGQPVGLVIDKRLGGLANLGPQVVTNGTFSGNTTGWSEFSVTSVTDAEGVTLTNTGTNGKIIQQLTLAANKTVALSFTLYSGTINAYLSLDGLATGSSTGSLTTPKRYTYYFTTTQANQWVALYNIGASGAVLKVGNVSVREVPGNHAIQATSASRPTCDARVNLLTYSEQFENAAWTKGGGATIVANAATAPDGTATADKLRSGAVSGESRVQQSITVTAGVSYTFTGYAKRSEWRYVYAYGDGTVFPNNVCIVDLETGVITANTGSSGSITAVGDGWYRVQWTATALSSGTNAVRFGTTNSPSTVTATGDGTSGIFIWGADHRVTSDNALPYQRVVVANDYADVQAPRYLTFDGLDDSLYTAANVDFATWTSGARRNLLLYPSAFDNSYWVKNSVTVTANNAVAPDGTLTADTLTATAATTSYINSSAITVAASTEYAVSVYIRAGSSATSRLRVMNSTATINIANSAITWSGGVPSVGANTGWSSTPTITLVGSGWYRIAGAFSSGAITSIAMLYYPDDNLTANTSIIWGAQLELGTTATTFQDVGTDKMSVFTGMRKATDFGGQMVVELGNAANDGIYIYVPSAGAGYQFKSGGTIPRVASSAATFPAPRTDVVTGLGDIAADIAQIRVAGALSGSDPADQGTGTFGTYVLFIGRRNNATLPFNGRLYQLMVRGALTDSGVVNQVELWVASKTGVTIT